MKTAIYAGTFDPLTKGHLDVLMRACNLFDEVIIAVAPNYEKGPLFTLEERIELIQENITTLSNVKVQKLQGLTVDFAKKIGACAIVRGLRAVSDFEYEFQMAQMNRHLQNDIETILLLPNHEQFYTSSHLIKSVAPYTRERLRKFVPDNVVAALDKKIGTKR